MKAAIESIKKLLPTPIYDALRFLRRWRDYPMLVAFLFDSKLHASFGDRLRIIRQAYLVSFRVRCPHTQGEVFSFIRNILSLPPDGKGVVVEAGCFKGGSTAKFSLAAEIAGRELVVFDSFEGIPPNEEHGGEILVGGPSWFEEGSFCGALEEVKANVAKYGKIERCRFIQGWFDDTMPHFHEPVAAGYIDVDLASSTKTCLRYLFPLLRPGGMMHSQDGHLSLVCDVLDDGEFWTNEVGCQKPKMLGLRTSKLVTIIKDSQAANVASGSLLSMGRIREA